MPTLPTAVDSTFEMRHVLLPGTWKGSGGAYFNSAHGSPADGSGLVSGWAPLEGAHQGTATGGVYADYSTVVGQRTLLFDSIDGVMRFSGFPGLVSGDDVGFFVLLEGYFVEFPPEQEAVLWSLSKDGANQPLHYLSMLEVSNKWWAGRQGSTGAAVSIDDGATALGAGTRFQIAASFTGKTQSVQLTTGSGTSTVLEGALDAEAATFDTLSLCAGLFATPYAHTKIAARTFAFRLALPTLDELAALAAAFGR